MTKVKLDDIKEKSVEELNEEVVSLRKKLVTLRMSKAMHKLEDTSEIRKAKHRIAQLKTVIREKQLSK